MPAKITVTVELAQLLANAQATTEANRRSQRRRDADQQGDRKRLEAKRIREIQRERQEMEDPTGRKLRTAAMGQQATTQYPGYYMRKFEPTALKLSIRSGVKATVSTIYYDDVTDAGYANQSTVVTLPTAAALDFTVFALTNCPEYAKVIAEASPLLGFVDLSGDPSWYIGPGWYRLFSPVTFFNFYNYYDTITNPATGLTEPAAFKVRDISQVGSSDPNFQAVAKDFSFTSYQNQDGSALPKGRFIYAAGYENSQSYSAGTFTGYVVERDQSPAYEFGVLVPNVTRFDTIPVTGGWSAASSAAGPTTTAWIVAESANVPSSQSLVSASVGALNLTQAFAGDYSSWPGAGSGGTMIQLFPRSGGGGGGGGGE